MKIVLYTQSYFLDAILETIQSLKSNFRLYLFIEIAPESMRSTVINLNTLNGLSTFEEGEVIFGSNDWKKLYPYFQGVEEVKFIIHHSAKSFSFPTFLTAAQVGNYIRRLKPTAVYFDTISTRSIGILPYILYLPIYIAIHDPLPHSGEGSWKKTLLRKLFYPRATGFFFYSKFARSQFEVHFSTYTAKRHELIFQPFSYIKNLTDKVSSQGKYILFFGRLSHYKGIDLLLEAIPKVISVFPNEHFVIAGNDEGYVLDKTILEQYKEHITIDDTYQTTSQLATKILNSKFIICPYRDATQSGVLMTANALGKIALATNVGAFPEYIENEVNGLLVEPDVDAIASAMILVLKNEWYKEMEMNLTVAPSNMVAQLNETAFLTAFKY